MRRSFILLILESALDAEEKLHHKGHYTVGWSLHSFVDSSAGWMAVVRHHRPSILAKSNSRGLALPPKNAKCFVVAEL